MPESMRLVSRSSKLESAPMPSWLGLRSAASTICLPRLMSVLKVLKKKLMVPAALRMFWMSSMISTSTSS